MLSYRTITDRAAAAAMTPKTITSTSAYLLPCSGLPQSIQPPFPQLYRVDSSFSRSFRLSFSLARHEDEFGRNFVVSRQLASVFTAILLLVSLLMFRC